MQIEVDVTSKDIYTSSQVYQETLILSDDSSDWSKTTVNIKFENIDIALFIPISNISLSLDETYQINVDLGNHSFKARNCDGQDIEWIWYSSDSKSVFIFDSKHWNYTFGRFQRITF